MTDKNFCNTQYEELIHNLIDMNLSVKEINDIKKHLSICDICKNTYEKYTIIDNALKNLKAQYNNYSVNKDFSSKIMKKIYNISINDDSEVQDEDLDYISAAGNNYNPFQK